MQLQQLFPQFGGMMTKNKLSLPPIHTAPQKQGGFSPSQRVDSYQPSTSSQKEKDHGFYGKPEKPEQEGSHGSQKIPLVKITVDIPDAKTVPDDCITQIDREPVDITGAFAVVELPESETSNGIVGEKITMPEFTKQDLHEMAKAITKAIAHGHVISLTPESDHGVSTTPSFPDVEEERNESGLAIMPSFPDVEETNNESGLTTLPSFGEDNQ